MGKRGEIKPGDVLADRYRVDRLLGKGGMGIVLTATDKQLRRRVALKTLLPSLVADDESVARFLREARAAARLAGDHSVRVIDVGELKDGAPFMVMELLSGRDLGQVLEDRKRLPVPEAVDYVLQAAEGVAEAHALGIVHRDLKPRNLFLTRRPDGSPLVKVLDFGLAKSAAPGERGLTATAAILGSPEYMSPEQLRGTRDVDVRTDLWSLGACLYELVAGVPPFSAPTLPDLMAKVLGEEPIALQQMFADVPASISDIALRCLRKAPAERYADVGELAEALEPFGSAAAIGAGQRIRRVLTLTTPASERPAPLAVDPHAETATAATFDSQPALTKKRVLVPAAAGLAIVAAIAGPLAMVRSTPPGAPATSNAAAAPPIALASTAATETAAAAAPSAASGVAAFSPTASASAAASAPPPAHRPAQPRPPPSRKDPAAQF